MTREDMASLCCNAQDFIDNWDAYKASDAMEPVSSLVACFLAKNTIDGSHGVERDIAHDHLAGASRGYKEWMVILNDLASDLGGWQRKVS